MKTDIFKILRCKCGRMKREAEPAPTIPPCPKCGGIQAYSENWYTKVNINGKPHIKSIGTHRRQAVQVLEQTRADIVYNKFLKGDQAPLLSEAIENTWKEKWKRNKDGARAKTRSEVILEIIGDLPLDELDKKSYRLLVTTLEKREIEDSSINRYLACLKTILRRHKLNYSFIEMLGENEGRIYVITTQEEQQITEILRDKTRRHWPNRQNYLDDLADMVTILIDTGCRIGELLRFTARDINLETNLITIWINKADKPRSIPMTDRCRTIMTARLEQAPLFACNQNQVRQGWNMIKTIMGNNEADFVPHALRHTCATRLLESGIDIYTVKEWLGHKTIQTTLRYVHLMPGRLAHAATALQAFVNKSLTAPASG